MTCRECALLLLDYLANELAEEQRQQVDVHFRHCPTCVAFFETYERTIHLTRQLPTCALPTAFQARLTAVLMQSHEKAPAPSA